MMESEISEKEDRIREENMEKECVREFLAKMDKQAQERFWHDVMEAQHVK